MTELEDSYFSGIKEKQTSLLDFTKIYLSWIICIIYFQWRYIYILYPF